MKFFYIIFILISFQLNAQWTSLIGDDLSNWRTVQGKAIFELNDGIISSASVLNSPNTFLITKDIYSDFILEFEVFVEEGLNSGVQFRSQIKEDHKPVPFPYVFGYQCEIDTNEFRRWTGGIYDESRSNLFLYPITYSRNSRYSFNNNQWNKFRIEAIGNSIKTFVNGIQCTNLLDDKSNQGFIGLQLHSIQNKNEVGKKVLWKNIRIATEKLEELVFDNQEHARIVNNIDNFLSDYEVERGWEFLFDGKTFKGWRSAKGDSFPEKGWNIQNGHLVVESSDGSESTNGGDIVTIEQFDDFELELDFMVSKGGNSGIKYYVDTDKYKVQGSSIGLEFQILDDFNHPDAKKRVKVYELNSEKEYLVKDYVKSNRTVGSLYDLIEAKNLNEPRSKRPVKHDTWHRARIISNNGNVEHWLDNIKVLEYNRYSQVFDALIQYSKYSIYEDFGKLKSGSILLQDHGDLVKFKNIKIRRLNNEK